MSYLNQPTIKSFYAKDATTGQGVAGDAPNMTAGLLGDATGMGASGTILDASGGLYYIDISAGENAFQEMTLIVVSSTLNVVIEPVRWSNDLVDDPAAPIDALSNTLLSMFLVSSGTATAGSASTITLQFALGANDLAKGCVIVIASGTGAKQVNTIGGYVNSTKVATMARPWEIAPDATSIYFILSAQTLLAASQIFIKKNVAFANFPFEMRLSATNQLAPGVTPTCTIQKDNGVFAAVVATAVEKTSDGNPTGCFRIDFAQAETNATVMTFKATATGCLDTVIDVVTQP